MPESTSPRDGRPIDLLVIGHVCRDLLDNDPASDRYLLGGTVSFAAVTGVRLGKKTAILTRAAPDMDLSALPTETDLHVLSSATTTTFANIYTDQGRIQYCYTPAAAITGQDVPAALTGPGTVLLGPLANEVGEDVPQRFEPNTVVGAVPQGWMRQWDATGRVTAKEWTSMMSFLPHLDVLILSKEDVDNDLSRLEPFFRHVPLVVLTEYRDGSTVYQRQADGSQRVTRIPPRPAREVDPTGAGDTFAAAFLIYLQETGDALQAARFANITASFGVEAPGVAGIPERQTVLAYMDAHPFVPET